MILIGNRYTLDLDFLNIEENLSHQFLSFFGMKIGVLIDLDSLDTGLEGGRKDIRGGAIETVSCARSRIASVSVSSISKAKSKAVQPFFAATVGSAPAFFR